MKLEIISKYPSDSTHPTPLLFIHGSLHGAWCWDVHFLDYFAQHGFAAHAVNLRGHGNSEGREKLRSQVTTMYLFLVGGIIRHGQELYLRIYVMTASRLYPHVAQ